MRNCPSCNHVILEDESIFCNKCGGNLIQPNVKEGEEIREENGEFCQNCGTNIDSTAKFCKGCGVSLQDPIQAPRPPSSGSVNYFQKYKKGILGAAVVLIIIIAGMMFNSANTPFKKMEGYWFTPQYSNFIKIEPKSGKMMGITFYDDGSQNMILHGTVLSHTKKSVEMSLEQNGETIFATLKLIDKSNLSFSVKEEDRSVEDVLLFEKKTKSDFDKQYTQD